MRTVNWASAVFLAIALWALPIRPALSAPAAVNHQAEQWVYNTGASTIRAGCGFFLSGGTTNGAFNVALPAGADSYVDGVAESDIPSSSSGRGYQAALSNVPILLSTAASSGDTLNIAAADGSWQTAPMGAKNIIFKAYPSGAAGTTIWGLPFAARSVPSPRFVSGNISGTGSAQNTAHGFAVVPTCTARLVGLLAGISLLSDTVIVSGTPTATNCVFTAPLKVVYQVEATVP